ncbi:MAG: glycoside hydrolase family 3 N-terminal domain-containing protein [Nitrososphaerota archaeon]|nr:glycoside hydrolase family 3 C-terminal domain-containing protein [Candidatus Bathyarchaeota archaeon]MDW8049154.1 glycoside hydrolase family 3 N-terminal domain-containing protein [Nitrososphaerota archaeon]
MQLDATVEERVNDLLAKMSLEEKIGQLKAKWLHRDIQKQIFSLLEPAPAHKKDRIAELFFSVFRDREVSDPVISAYVRKHWKDLLRNERNVGMLSLILRSFPPREAAELHNEIQSFLIENTRLKIPIIIHDEGLHGCMATGCTIFPQSIGLASTWNPELMEKVGAAIGRETRAHGIHHLLSPTINIARDPRCGRTEETYGEDPYLTSTMAVAFIRGVQSEGVICTPKHFAANFVGDGGRDSNPIHFSERILREVYFPAFEESVRKGGAMSIMAAYNSIDGVPCSCNRWLLTEILRKEWGFKGFVVSDYWSVTHVMTKHGVAGTKKDAAEKCLKAGLDVELPESDCYEHLLDLVREGKITEEEINEAVRRVLRAKFWLGLFENPFIDCDLAEKVCNSEEHRKLALEAARQSIVLLKNDGILPLTKELKSIAVLGPNAAVMRLGGYSGYGVKTVSPLEGIRNELRDSAIINYAEGCDLISMSKEGFKEAIRAAKNSEAAIICVGNSVPETEGEQRDRCNLDLPGVQEDLIKEVSELGVPTIVVLINGSAITMTKWLDHVDAVIEAWYPGEEGGNAIAEVIFGDYNPGGRLPITFPKFVGQLPLYYNSKPTGRVYDYVDLRGTQYLFPFGYGLSYAQFEYSNLRITPDKINPKETVRIRVDVKNIGACKGDEVVQLYLRDTLASVARPLKELRGFKRISLQPGEQETVEFTIGFKEISFYDEKMNLVVEPGTYEVMVGASSEDIRLKGSFTVI